MADTLTSHTHAETSVAATHAADHPEFATGDALLTPGAGGVASQAASNASQSVAINSGK